MSVRHGSTLVELSATLAIMAIVAGVVVLALRTPQRGISTADVIQQARRDAVLQRRAVTIDVVQNGRTYALTALPDGGVIADTALRIDRFTGDKSDAR